MKVSCKRENLTPLFALASKAVAVRDTRPVLQNIKMVADQDRIILTATNGEIGIRLELADDVQVEDAGEIILGTQVISRVLSVTTAPTLTFETKDNYLGITGERIDYKFPIPSFTDFPVIAPFEETSYLKLEGKVFLNLIQHTVFATEAESSKYALAGVNLEFTENEITAVATDGKRMAFQTGKAETVGDYNSVKAAIVPTKAFEILEKAMNANNETLFAVNDNQLVVKNGNTIVRSQLVSGRYPQWRKIIPSTDQKKVVDFIAGSLYSAIMQASIVTTQKDPGIRLIFNSGRLELEAMGNEVGQSRIELPIAYDDEEVIVKLEPKYVTEFLRILPAEEAIVLYFQANVPVFFKTSDNYSYVVMPLV